LHFQNQIVALEQAGDAGLVDLHLQAADAQRAKDGHALALDRVVGDLDTLDAERRHGVQISGGFQSGTPGPG
jgi:hypothetical protein